MRPRFSLRHLLIAFTLIAIALGGVTNFVYRIKTQVRLTSRGIAKAEELGGHFSREFLRNPTTYEAIVQHCIDKNAYRPIAPFALGHPELFRFPSHRAEAALEALKDVYGVTIISISVERFTVKSARLIAEHPQLMHLEIDCETVESGAEAELAKIKSLVALQFKFAISDQAVEAAAHLPRLHLFEINPDAMTDQGVQQLQSLKHLQSLILFRSARPARVIESLANHPALVQLYFSECQLDDEATKALGQFKQLKELHLFNGLVSIEPLIEALTECGSLEAISLRGLPITAQHGVSKLANCKSLEYINAECLHVTSEDLWAFKGLKQLKELDFCGKVDAQQMELLLSAMPNCTVSLRAPALNIVGFKIESGSRIRYSWENGKLKSEDQDGAITYGGIR
jgi:hypothetical protein